MSTSHEAPDEERLASYLSRQLPDARDLEVVKLSRNVGGMSRETWFADTVWQDADGARQEATFTVRADHPEGSVVPTPLEYEYKVYRALSDTDVPVARALWHEPDPSWLGRAFYIRDTIPGSSAPKQLFKEGEEQLRRSIGEQLAVLLARIHTLDWQAAGLGEFMAVPQTAEDCARLEIDRWRAHYEQNRSEARPVVTELYSWLNRNAPTQVPRTSLVWGDVGLGNFIFDQDEVVGLTDWEQAHLGDPMKDWSSALYRGVDNLLPKQELFEIYERESGISIDEERIHYYTVFIDAQYVSISHPMVRRIVEHDGQMDIALVRLAMGFPFDCQDDGLRAIGY